MQEKPEQSGEPGLFDHLRASLAAEEVELPAPSSAPSPAPATREVSASLAAETPEQALVTNQTASAPQPLPDSPPVAPVMPASLSAEAPWVPPVPPAPPLPPRVSPPVARPAAYAASSGGWWTIPLLCIGLCLIACALVIGQVEVNRQLAWQRNKLKQDYEYLQRQIKVNDEFLKDIQTNPTLAERLAQRQMKEVRQGTAVLDVPALGKQNDRNPFVLVTIAPPPPLKPYEPRNSLLVWLCGTEQRRLAITALGLFLIAAGLVLGGPNEPAALRPRT